MRLLFFILVIVLNSACAWAGSICAKDICINVKVVSKPEDLERGLQGRKDLKENEGMLFVFKEDGWPRFWMKGMRFAIDMIWIDAERKIVTIAPSRQPCVSDPCAVYSPLGLSRYVLEVSSGFSLRHHLRPGDIFEFKDIN